MQLLSLNIIQQVNLNNSAFSGLNNITEDQ